MSFQAAQLECPAAFPKDPQFLGPFRRLEGVLPATLSMANSVLRGFFYFFKADFQPKNSFALREDRISSSWVNV